MAKKRGRKKGTKNKAKKAVIQRLNRFEKAMTKIRRAVGEV